VTEFLFSVDRSVFLFINQTLSNPVGDILWPIITDYDKLLVFRVLLVIIWLWLLIRGGVPGRDAALLLIPVIVCSDTLSSKIIKELVARPRPCHEIDGSAVIPGIHLLVDCGAGKSFPSSHAVNNFAAATVFSFYYRKLAWAFAAWAALVALSRPAVGVHYPSDIIAGALVGVIVAAIWIWLWLGVQKRFFPMRLVAFQERLKS
jgi:undecaprenyl-diphosphatase